MRRPDRLPFFPELFLGLLVISIGVIVTSHVLAGAFLQSRRNNETIKATGSARYPIDANLVNWVLTVTGEGSSPARAADRLRPELAAVRKFLIQAGIPASSIAESVVSSDESVIPLPHKRSRTVFSVSQELGVSTPKIDIVEGVAIRLSVLIGRGINVSADSLEYVSTELTHAKLKALQEATAEARNRAEILVEGLGGSLGPMRASSQGVFQVTPRYSTDVSNYGINDTSSRQKDVTAVVSATFAVKR